MRTWLGNCTLLLVLAAAAPPARGAHRIVGGPFLTDLSPEAVTISWQTKYLSAGKVELTWPSGRMSVRSKDGRRVLHHVRATGLPADTEISYQVFLDGEPLRVYRFRTAPVEPRPFRFAAYGDSQERRNGRHGRIANAILRHRPAFVVHSGDYIMRSGTSSEWSTQFFQPASDLLAHVPIVAAMGNREAGCTAYLEYFGYTVDRTWQSWTYSNAEFFVVNSNEDLLPDSPQHVWLTGALAASRAKWKIVVFHHPLYSGSRHGSDLTLRCVLMPVFLEHGVDLVVVGHDQCYERTHPIGSGDDPESNALYQVVTGGGGGSTYDVQSEVWTARAVSDHHYCIVDVTDSTLTVTAYALDGKPFDCAVMTKEGARRRCEGALAAEAINFFDAATQFSRLYLPVVGAGETNNVRLRFSNPYPRPLRGSLAWKLPNRGWSIEPAVRDIVVPAGGKLDAYFTVSFDPNAAGATAHQQPVVLLTHGAKTVAVPAFGRSLRRFASPLLTK